MTIKDERGREPQFVIVDNVDGSGDILRHQPTGIFVTLPDDWNHRELREAMIELGRKI